MTIDPGTLGLTETQARDRPGYLNVLPQQDQIKQQSMRPAFDYDSAIKRRMEDIGSLGDEANRYYHQKAMDKIKARQSAADNAVTSYDNFQAAGGYDPKNIRSRLVSGAAAYQGVDYQWGGASPKGFDCSGLVQYVYGQMGIKMPRVSQQQATKGRLQPVNTLKPGDLVAWGSSPATAHHIAIYAGNGLVWEAPHKGAQVRLRKVNPSERGIMGIGMKL